MADGIKTIKVEAQRKGCALKKLLDFLTHKTKDKKTKTNEMTSHGMTFYHKGKMTGGVQVFQLTGGVHRAQDKIESPFLKGFISFNKLVT